MLPKPKRVANISGAAFLFSIAVTVIAARATRGETYATSADVVTCVAGIAASICYFVGFRYYAVAKGYPGERGLSLAMLNVLGALILLSLKDRHPAG